MTTKLAALTQNAAADAIALRMVSGTIKIYSGSQPATADTAVTGTLLATLTLDATPTAAAAAGVVTFNDLPLSVNAVATGTAGYFRIATSGAASVMDGACGTSGTEMILSTTSLVSGVAVTLTSVSSFTVPTN